jgi:hypothetical protein
MISAFGGSFGYLKISMVFDFSLDNTVFFKQIDFFQGNSKAKNSEDLIRKN